MLVGNIEMYKSTDSLIPATLEQRRFVMRIGTPKEIFLGENRVAMTPAVGFQMQKLGYECFIEKGAGEAASVF